jgi:hypothetical protein
VASEPTARSVTGLRWLNADKNCVTHPYQSCRHGDSLEDHTSNRHDRYVLARRSVIALVAVSLVAAAGLDTYRQVAGAGSWIVVDLLLLLLAVRGHSWAWTILVLTSAFWAALLMVAGVSQVGSNPQYLCSGLAFAAATAGLQRLRQQGNQHVLSR